MIDSLVRIKIDLQLSPILILKNKKKDKDKAKIIKKPLLILTFIVLAKHLATSILLMFVLAPTIKLLKETTSPKQAEIKIIKLIDQFLKLRNKVNFQIETTVYLQIREKPLTKNLEPPQSIRVK